MHSRQHTQYNNVIISKCFLVGNYADENGGGLTLGYVI